MNSCTIDRLDVTSSNLALIIFKALRTYEDSDVLEWLTDDDCLLRRAAARELHLRPTRRVFDRVAAVASSARFEHRVAAAIALGQLGTPNRPYFIESLPILENLLDDAYFEVRSEAILAFGHLCQPGQQLPPQIVQRLLDEAGSKRWEVREAVGYALLGISGVERIAAVLDTLKRDEVEAVRNAADFCVEARLEIEQHR